MNFGHGSKKIVGIGKDGREHVYIGHREGNKLARNGVCRKPEYSCDDCGRLLCDGWCDNKC